MCLLKSIDYMLFKILPVVSGVKVSLSKNFYRLFSQHAVFFFISEASVSASYKSFILLEIICWKFQSK